MTMVSPLHTLSAIALLTCASCNSQPSAEIQNWQLARQANGKTYSFTAKGHLLDGEDGFFQAELEAIDERGCHYRESLDPAFPAAAQDPDAIPYETSKKFTYPWKIARATLLVRYRTDDISLAQDAPVVFSDTKTIDPSLRPPDMPKKPCSETGKSNLSKRAQIDPEGADAAAIDNMSREEVVATTINTAGYLCARVTDMYPSGGNIIAHCVEYRNGRGRVKYRIDTANMTVEPL